MPSVRVAVPRARDGIILCVAIAVVFAVAVLVPCNPERGPSGDGARTDSEAVWAT